MNYFPKLMYLALAFALLILMTLAVRAGIADIQSSTTSYYLGKASEKGNTSGASLNFLNAAKTTVESAIGLDSNNSDLKLQAARIYFELDRQHDNGASDSSFYQSGLTHLKKGLRLAPTRSDLWTEYAKISSEKEGATKATLAALDKALKFGPKERSTLMVNAVVTLYFWGQLDSQRQSRGWLLVLDAMDDRRLAKEITKMARQTGWEKQLQRSLRDR